LGKPPGVPLPLPRGRARGRQRRQLDVLHVSDRQLQEADAHLTERLGIAGREEAIRPLARDLVPVALARERLRNFVRGLLGGEDERHIASEHALEDRADQRIVRAAEDDGVDTRVLQRRRILAHRSSCLRAERIVALDQRH
jgi:hypothetical protein